MLGFIGGFVPRNKTVYKVTQQVMIHLKKVIIDHKKVTKGWGA